MRDQPWVPPLPPSFRRPRVRAGILIVSGQSPTRLGGKKKKRKFFVVGQGCSLSQTRIEATHCLDILTFKWRARSLGLFFFFFASNHLPALFRELVASLAFFESSTFKIVSRDNWVYLPAKLIDCLIIIIIYESVIILLLIKISTYQSVIFKRLWKTRRIRALNCCTTFQKSSWWSG